MKHSRTKQGPRRAPARKDAAGPPLGIAHDENEGFGGTAAPQDGPAAATNHRASHCFKDVLLDIDNLRVSRSPSGKHSHSFPPCRHCASSFPS
jgi:hypothetical protein